MLFRSNGRYQRTADGAEVPARSCWKNIMFWFGLALFVQVFMILGYFLLENVHTVADHIDRVGGYISSSTRLPSSSGSKQSQELGAFISLVRNQELDDLLPSINMVEETFNHKFHYPWVFFNDEEFTEDFKTLVSKAVSSKAEFVKIKKKDWEAPKWIDMDKAERLGKQMKENGVRYADKMSYHKMCRWNSGVFYQNPVMDKYKYYWRVEPGTKYYCTLDYDVFKFMDANDKDYGFVINIYDSPLTVKTLWNNTLDFFEKYPQFVAENNAYDWLTQESHNSTHNSICGYSTCHFWSNFEIGRMEFFRSEGYQKYFEWLDRAGGFFYERWGDAPVHSVALGMMTDKKRIHYFDDIGYFHYPYFNCPDSEKCKDCEPNKFTEEENLHSQNCLDQWKKFAELE